MKLRSGSKEVGVENCVEHGIIRFKVDFTRKIRAKNSKFKIIVIFDLSLPICCCVMHTTTLHNVD